MKRRKTFSILLTVAFVAGLILIPAAPAAAAVGSFTSLELVSVPDGYARWTTDEYYTGDYSAELDAGDGSDAGRVYMWIEPILFQDVDSVTYMAYEPVVFPADPGSGVGQPYINLYLDTDGVDVGDPADTIGLGGGWTRAVNGELPPASEWTEMQEDWGYHHGDDWGYLEIETPWPWTGFLQVPQVEPGTLEEWKAWLADPEGGNYPAAVLYRMRITYGYWNVVEELEPLYVDDLKINGDTYDLEPRVINTDTGELFDTIQPAIDAASVGETILVQPGIYYESIDIDKSLTLESSGDMWDTTIDATDEADDVIDVTGPASFVGTSLVIDGFEIKGDGGDGINIANLELIAGVTIQNCVIHGNPGDGIHVGQVDPAASITIQDNIISDNTGAGIDFGTTDAEMMGTATILGNIIGGFCFYDGAECVCWDGNDGDGIYMNLVSGTVTIGGVGIDQANLIAGNGYGTSDGVQIHEVLPGGVVDIIGNIIGAWEFWIAEDEEYCRVDGNYGDGIDIYQIDQGGTVNIHHNAISENDDDGIRFDNGNIAGVVTIIGNTIGAWTWYPADYGMPGTPVRYYGNLEHGINIYYDITPTGYVLIQGNYIAENEEEDSGIHVDEEVYGVLDILDNYIGAWTDEYDVTYDGNAGCGVYIYAVDGGTATIGGNHIEDAFSDNTDTGIDIWYIYKFSTVSIEDNTITSPNLDCIYLYDVHQHADVSITGNTLSGGGESGIWLDFYMDMEMESADGIDITCNLITNNYHGIWVGGDYNNISRNQISNNVGGDMLSGIHLSEEAEFNHINLNSITDNTADGSYGVYNASSSLADATNNWWGHASGPGGSGPGSGDWISDMVLYSPYLTTDPFLVYPATSCPDVVGVTPDEGKLYPVIEKAEASPAVISLWSDGMFDYLWGDEGGGDNTYTVGPSCRTMFSVVAHDYETGALDQQGIYSVTMNWKDVLIDYPEVAGPQVVDGLIPLDKLEKFVDNEEAWNYFLNDLEVWPMDYDGTFECWLYDDCKCDNLDLLLWDILKLNPTEYTEIMGQELNLGDFEMAVTVTDYEGNYTIGYISITIVDYQMPVCEGWNLRSTWLTLEDDRGYNTWEKILATMQHQDGKGSLLRWNNTSEYQRWETYDEADGGGWYFGGVKIDDALMEPLDAYWIHSPYNDQFGLVTSRDATAPPSKQLNSGWNLIGVAPAWMQPSLPVEVALLSVYEGEEHCTGYIHVLSVDQYNYWNEYYYKCGTYQYDNYWKEFWQDTWIFTRDFMDMDGGPDGAPRMTRGGGYWEFQQNPALLAGLSHTPLPEGFWSPPPAP